MNYAKTIRRLAKKKGITTRELKQRIGMSEHSSIVYNIPTKRVLRLIEELDVSQEVFYLHVLYNSDALSDKHRIRIKNMIEEIGSGLNKK